MDSEPIEVDFSAIIANYPRQRVVEWAWLPSGRLVVIVEGGESLVFEANGTSPKGSYLTQVPPPVCKES